MYVLGTVSHFRRRSGIQGTSDTHIYREMRLNVIIYIPLVGPNGYTSVPLSFFLFCLNNKWRCCTSLFFSRSYGAHHCIIVFALVFLSAEASAAALPLLLQLLFLWLNLSRWFTRSVWENSGIRFDFFFFFPCHIPTGRKTAALKFCTGVKARKKLTSLLRIHPEGSSETSFQKTERRHICCIRRWTPLTINLIARLKFYPPELGERDKSNFVSRLIRWARRPWLRTTRISIFFLILLPAFFFLFLSLRSPHKEIGGCPGVHFNDRTDPTFCLLLSSAVLTACDKPQIFF